MHRSAQLFRLIRIITAIEANPGRMNAARLAKDLEYSERTIYRDLGTLELAGIPIYYDRGSSGYRIMQGFFLPPVNLSMSELIALHLASEALDSSPFKEGVQSVLEKALCSVGKKKRDHLTRLSRSFAVSLDASVISKEQKSMFAALNRAISEHRIVKFKYRASDKSKAMNRKVSPYALTFRSRSWYLLGYCHWRKKVLVFRTTRMSEARLSPERFEMPEGFNLGDYFKGAWRVIGGEPQLVRIKFDKVVADDILETTWHPDQEVERLKDGSVIFSVNVSSLSEISAWVLSWGKVAEVLEPEELREMVKGEIEKLKQIYAANRRDNASRTK
ncbi:WYL domain-containing protein [candidate division WOR-3 bacterium]|nr:WYL domain-containing protein [candidate division WOR-3 bacterium]